MGRYGYGYRAGGLARRAVVGFIPTGPKVWIDTDLTIEGSPDYDPGAGLTDQDDLQSFIYQLLASNLVNIVGISTNAIDTNTPTPAQCKAAIQRLLLTEYADDYAYLNTGAVAAGEPRYPPPSYLANRVYAGEGAAQAGATPVDGTSEAFVALRNAIMAASVEDPINLLVQGPKTNNAQIVKWLIANPSYMDNVRLASTSNFSPNYNYSQDTNAASYVNARLADGSLLLPWTILDQDTHRGVYVDASGNNEGNAGWYQRYCRGRGRLGARASRASRGDTYYKAGDLNLFWFVEDQVRRGVGPDQAGWGGRFTLDATKGANTYYDTPGQALGTRQGAKTVRDNRINPMNAFAARLARLPFAGVRLDFTAATANVNEGSAVTITVTRTTDTSTVLYDNIAAVDVYGAMTAVSGEITLTGGTAVAADFDDDSKAFSLSAGTLNSPGADVTGGETTKGVNFTATADLVTEGSETAVFTPTALTGSAFVGATNPTHTVTIADTSSYDSTATAYFAAMSSQPDATRKTNLDNLIRDVKAITSGAAWGKIDRFYILLQQSEQAMRVCVKTQAVATLTVVGGTGPAFSADAGFLPNDGAGNTGYIDSGFSAATGGAHYTQNSATMGADARTAVIDNGNAMCGTTYMTIAGNDGASGNQFRGRLNTLSTAGVAWDHTSPITGLFVATRNGAVNTGKWLHNGDVKANVSSGTDQAPSGNFIIGRREGGTGYSLCRIGLAFIGSAFTDAEVTAFDDAWQTFLTAVGKTY